MLRFPIEREYGHKIIRKQKRKQRINNSNNWWEVTNFTFNTLIFDKRGHQSYSGILH